MTPQKAVILVPVADRIAPPCEEALRGLESQGYLVRRFHGYRSLDLVRNQMASDALADGFDELIWIDPHIAFELSAIERLRSHQLPLVCGVYPVGRQHELSCQLPPEIKELSFGTTGGLQEVIYTQLGFAYTHRVVYDRIHADLKLPVCKQPYGRALVPFFAPSAVQDGQTKDWVYLSEDYSFCQRCRRVNSPIMIDTSIRLWVEAGAFLSWEEIGQPRERYESLTLDFGKEGS
jgi:hypothetical protein